MPLLVHCPNRCQIRVPSNRMGKVIRCVDCQTPIMIPEVESPLLRTGNWVECRAKRAIKKKTAANAADCDEQAPTTDPSFDESLVSPTSPIKPSSELPLSVNLPPVSPKRTARLLRAKPWRTVEPLTSVDPEDVLTPIDLDDTPSPTPTDHSDTSKNLESTHLETTEEQVIDSDPHQPPRLSLISRLLWFANPFV